MPSKWWGKIVGGGFGYMIGGPIGAFLGALIGGQFDRGLSLNETVEPATKTDNIKILFYTTTFGVMGHICKSDGHVSQDEISLANNIMREINLNEAQQDMAKKIFNAGKAQDFQWQEHLKMFYKVARPQRNLLRLFLEVQILAALSDGKIHDREYHLLSQISDILHVSKDELSLLIAMLQESHGKQQQSKNQPATSCAITAAYKVLGLQKGAKKTEIKQAYRRLMSQHHPDKLVAKGLPEEMMALATKRTKAITKAYKTLKNANQA